MATPIYIIGSSNTDMVVKGDKLPMPGETVIGGMFFMNPGGKGANQAVACARLGGNATLVARVGNDLFGGNALNQFRTEGINTDFINQDEKHPSGVALIGVDKHAENLIIVAPGANNQLDTHQVSEFLGQVRGDGIVLLQLEIPMESVEAAIVEAHRKGLKVILNPAPARKVEADLLRKLFLISPNETEAELLTGIQVNSLQSAEAAAKRLYESGVKHVTITLGKRGAYLFNSSGGKLIPAPEVDALDTTAAGDCFNGALAVALAEEQSIVGAIHFACCAASLSVTRMGAQVSMPYRHEVDGLVDSSEKLTHKS